MLIGSTFFMSTSSYEVKQHYVQVEQKVKADKKIFYITGKDPYIHNSKVVQIFINEEQYSELEQNAIYYIKYKTEDGKIFELTKIVHKK